MINSMDAMSETMVLKRKHSPTPQEWENSSEHNDEPASPSSSIDDVCYESTKPKKKRQKQVKFNGVTVYYFQRSQGFTCVPSQGGSTLGMEHIHDFKENYSLNGFALEQDRQHRELLKEQLLERKQRQMLEHNDPELLNKSIQEIADNELSNINVEEYYFLQPVTTKRRRLMLRSAGVKKIESWEKSELKKIRLSREKCGCDCKVVCNPSSCACSIAGIKCQVDRLSFPCGCSKDACGNNTGRVEFNPIKVRTHFLHTLMRLEVENGQDNECGMPVNRTDNDNEASYTKLENSVYLDESSDRVLDHGQCKECDSIPYTDYNDQYNSQYLNVQDLTKPGLHGQFIQQLDSSMYSNSITTPMNFSCANTDIPLDLQSQSNANNQLPCVLSYDDESKHNTLNSPVINSCNVPRSVISEYDSSTSEESATSESDSEPPYINPTTISLENTKFVSTSTNNSEKSIFQTPDSSPDQQYTKLMPLDLSHALANYETCDDAPIYTQLSTSSRTCSVSFCSQVSETPTMSSQASFYTDYVSDCQHLPFSTNACKDEKPCAQKSNTISSCSSAGQSDLFNLDNSQHIIDTENNNSTIPPINNTEPPVYADEMTIEYFQESALTNGPAGQNILNAKANNVHSEHYERGIVNHTSYDVTEKCLMNQEVPEIYLPSNEQDLPDATSDNCQPNRGTSDLLLLSNGAENKSRFIVEKIEISSSSGESVDVPCGGLVQGNESLEESEIPDSSLPSELPAGDKSLGNASPAIESKMALLSAEQFEECTSSDGSNRQSLPDQQLPSDETPERRLVNDRRDDENNAENCLAPNKTQEKVNDLGACVPLKQSVEMLSCSSSSAREHHDISNGILTNHETHQSDEMIDYCLPSKIPLDDKSSSGEFLVPTPESSPSADSTINAGQTIDEFVFRPSEDLSSNCLTGICNEAVTSTGESEEISGEHLSSKGVWKESPSTTIVGNGEENHHLKNTITSTVSDSVNKFY